jgi:hypothetical protein
MPLQQPQQQPQQPASYGGNKKFSGGYRRTRDSGLDDKAEEAISLGALLYLDECLGAAGISIDGDRMRVCLPYTDVGPPPPNRVHHANEHR